ncbi:hypothetical protein ACU686_14930 [Yinghuangia aomiensis]
MGQLIAGRVVSGVGAAGILPNTLALMTHGVSGAVRQRAVAVWASMTGLAAVAGNIGGGAALEPRFVAHVVRRHGGARAARCGRCRHRGARTAPPPPAAFRPPAPAVGRGVLALLYAILGGSESGWSSPSIVGAAVAACLALVAWAIHELRVPAAVVGPGLFVRPAVEAGAFGMAVVFLGLFGLLYINGPIPPVRQGLRTVVRRTPPPPDGRRAAGRTALRAAGAPHDRSTRDRLPGHARDGGGARPRPPWPRTRPTGGTPSA